MAINLLQAAQQFVGQIVQNGLQKNLQQTPWSDAAIQAIQNGDHQKGQQLAQNIIQSCGFSSPEEAVRIGLQNLSSNKH